MKNMKKYTPFVVVLGLMVIGFILKQLVDMYLPIDVMGTIKVDFLGDFCTLAYLKHINLDYLKISSADGFGLLVKIIFMTFIFAMQVIKENKDVKACAVGFIISAIAIITAATMGDPNWCSDLLAITLVAVLYCTGTSKISTYTVGLCAGGLWGNFLEGNIRGYVIDYLWFVPNLDNQVYNLEDIMIYVSVIVIGIILLVRFVNWMVEIAKH